VSENKIQQFKIGAKVRITSTSRQYRFGAVGVIKAKVSNVEKDWLVDCPGEPRFTCYLSGKNKRGQLIFEYQMEVI